MPEQTKPKFDLEARTGKFAESVIVFAKLIPKNPVTIHIITQFVDSGTSIGANYCEADCAESRKDFEHKLGICKKEAKETKHWLRVIAIAVPELAPQARVLWKEVDELQRIFIVIINNSRAKRA